MNVKTKAKIQKNLKTIPHVNIDSYFPKHQYSEKNVINLWPWLIVFCLLLMSVLILKMGSPEPENYPVNNPEYIVKAQQASQSKDDFYLPTPSIPQKLPDQNMTITAENPNPMLKTQPLTLANEQLVKPGDDSVFLNDVDTTEEENIEPALKLITSSKGRVIISGIGKSGLVGAKMAATLSSTGTAAYFIHSTDALHGDSGAILADDVVVAISNSGQTAEVVAFASMVKGWGNKVIAITGKPESELGRISDVVLDIAFEKESDSNGLAPTTSTTLTIALGDALAAALITCKNFTVQDFGKRHPGGALGKKSNG